jgi:hypothetical protein
LKIFPIHYAQNTMPSGLGLVGNDGQRSAYQGIHQS